MIEKLYDILNQFKPMFLIESKIYGEISAFINKEFKEKTPPLNSPLYYESTAFAFMEDGNRPEEWGDVFYSPLCGRVDPIAKKYQFSSPDITDITHEMLSYWEKRASEASNPILQCRYAGLVWDFSPKITGKKANISLAHKFIDSIIETANLGGDPFLKYKLKRALQLAVSINNEERISSLRDAVIKYEETHSEDDKAGTWGYSFDLLIGDKDLSKKACLTKEQESKIIKKLEERLTTDSNGNKEDPHHVEGVVSRLAPYYNRNQDRANLKRVLLTYRDSVLSGLKKGRVISGSHWLEKVRKILFQYSLSQEAKAIEKALRFYQKEDPWNRETFEISVEIPKKEVEDYKKRLEEASLSDALKKIAVSFIPDKDQSKEIVLKTAREHPLSFMILSRVMDHSGRKVAEIGPLEDDLDGHIVRQMQQSIQLSLPWIKLALDHLEKTKSLNANTLSECLFESPFLEERRQIIKEGLNAYFNKNYITSCSILIPQIEAAIREITAKAGGEIYKSPQLNEKGFVLRPLGSLLRDEGFYKIFENKNIPIYFRILLTDKRGFNFRNDICHGNFPGNHFTKEVAIYIIHLLLILSMLRQEKSADD